MLRRWAWAAASLLAAMAVILVGAIALASWHLSAPNARAVGAPPADLPAETVHIESGSGSTLGAWFVAGQPDMAGIIVMHGLGATRKSMTARMRWLNAAGYSVLAFDFQAHGESPGSRITFGKLERLDAEAALAWMRERIPGGKIGALGVSLGGAAALLGERPLPVDALVLEAAYTTIDEAVANRLSLRLGTLGRRVAPLFVAIAQSVVGLSPDDLRPIDRIGEVDAPLLIVAGTDDTRATIEQSRALYEQARQPKEFWEIEGADHVDFERFAGDAYRQRILAFFERTL